MGYILLEEKGFEKGSICKVADKITIGREPENTFQVFDEKASRVHVQIYVKESGLLFLEDLNSVNGTFLNGKKVKKKILKNWDKIRIGTTVFVVKDLSKKEEEEIKSDQLVVSSSYTYGVTQIQVERCPKCFCEVDPGLTHCPECGYHPSVSKT